VGRTSTMKTKKNRKNSSVKRNGAKNKIKSNKNMPSLSIRTTTFRPYQATTTVSDDDISGYASSTEQNDDDDLDGATASILTTVLDDGDDDFDVK